MKQWWIIILLITVCPLKADNIFIEAESFDKKEDGYWIINPWGKWDLLICWHMD